MIPVWRRKMSLVSPLLQNQKLSYGLLSARRASPQRSFAKSLQLAQRRVIFCKICFSRGHAFVEVARRRFLVAGQQPLHPGVIPELAMLAAFLLRVGGSRSGEEIGLADLVEEEPSDLHDPITGCPLPALLQESRKFLAGRCVLAFLRSNEPDTETGVVINIRVQFVGATQVHQGVFEVARGLFGHASVVESTRVFRVEFEGAVVVRNGAVQIVCRLLRISAIG